MKGVDAHDLSKTIEKNKDTSEKVLTSFSQRWILACLCFTGLFNVYAVRVNISVALVCMVKTPDANLTLNILPINNITKNDTGGVLYIGKQTQRGEFVWDKSTRSAILSSFFYGYMVMQIPGGWLADRFGGRRVFGLSMAIATVLTLLTPTCARISVKLV